MILSPEFIRGIWRARTLLATLIARLAKQVAACGTSLEALPRAKLLRNTISGCVRWW